MAKLLLDLSAEERSDLSDEMDQLAYDLYLVGISERECRRLTEASLKERLRLLGLHCLEVAGVDHGLTPGLDEETYGTMESDPLASTEAIHVVSH